MYILPTHCSKAEPNVHFTDPMLQKSTSKIIAQCMHYTSTIGAHYSADSLHNSQSEVCFRVYHNIPVDLL